MLPLKWKIFRVVCFLHIAAVLSCLTWIFIINGRYIFSGLYNFLEFLLVFSILLLLLANTFIDTWLLERYYPDRRPGRALNIWHTILFILYIPIVCLFTIGCFAMFFDIFLDDNKSEAMIQRGVLSWAVVVVISFTGLSICYFQISLRRTLRRNYQRQFDNFLNS
jgi:hypothetical protein